MGLVAPRHVGSSRTRARTRVPCIGRWILNHCTTREVPHPLNIYFPLVIIHTPFPLFFLTPFLLSLFSGTLTFLTCLEVIIPRGTILSETVPSSLLYLLLQRLLQFSYYFRCGIQQIHIKFLLCLNTHDVGKITEQVAHGIGPYCFCISSSVLSPKHPHPISGVCSAFPV